MFQFLINQTDADVEKLLKFMTFLSKEEIQNIMSAHKANPKLRHAQYRLAEEVIKDIHGLEVYKNCSATSKTLFNKDLNNLSADELFDALQGTNTFHATKSEYNIVDLLCESNLAESKTSARRLIESKAIVVNHKQINNIAESVTKANAFNKHFSYIKKGKKDYCLIIWS
jgi:tyrosyl-tRNA synthetase